MQYELEGETYFEVMSISRADLEEHFADDDLAEAIKKLADEDMNAIAEQMGQELFTRIFWITLNNTTHAYIAKKS
jgi:hypothetical protein